MDGGGRESCFTFKFRLFFFNKLLGLLHHIIEGSEVFRSDGWNLIIVNDFTFIIVKSKVNF